ncbi:NAD(P)-dependent oxidoreductase [Paraburkholderia sp. NPDC080076]|uniref:NAD(P)-dependent oxidoreductase n=1 Tax=Paraburkholderia sp. NPDC080076 TaxID=3390605 RepID=UPI003CFFC056
MMIRSVAVIGIGAMGAPMARRVQAAGFELIVCDRNEAATAEFAERGVRVASAPADCANADVILVLVATPDQVWEVILGERGILAGVTAQQSPVLAVMSTVSAEVIEDISLQLRSSKLRIIDAPISGGVRGAEQGMLTILTGGHEQDIEAVKPVFQNLRRQQIHCGGLGAAQTMKIVNNIIGVSVTVIAGEAYRLAIERGLDPARVSQVFEACSGRSARSKNPAGPQAGYAELVRDRASFAAVSAIMRKDLSLAFDMASHAQGRYPAVSGLKTLIDSLGDETFDHWRRIAELPLGDD